MRAVEVGLDQDTAAGKVGEYTGSEPGQGFRNGCLQIAGVPVRRDGRNGVVSMHSVTALFIAKDEVLFCRRTRQRARDLRVQGRSAPTP